MSHTIKMLNTMLFVPPTLAEAATKDAQTIAYLEGVLRTTMSATQDATTRRAIRVKLDALAKGEALSAPTPAGVTFAR